MMVLCLTGPKKILFLSVYSSVISILKDLKYYFIKNDVAVSENACFFGNFAKTDLPLQIALNLNVRDQLQKKSGCCYPDLSLSFTNPINHE